MVPQTARRCSRAQRRDGDNVGDEIRTTKTRSGALITFFSGTEMEMGEDTILVVGRQSRNGD